MHPNRIVFITILCGFIVGLFLELCDRNEREVW